ncbi:MAG TPA: aminotransferase class V-fold PLP-dependent enzyme [Cyclobacteriaceae bacterium]|nr:aminotransferase class V-fold PLP-dependent enzyme [Cyclobacteriaceae bacterium]
MSTKKSTQERMFSEVGSGLFEKAQSYGLEYLSKVFDRNVFPENQALVDLEKFVEEMPTQSEDASKVIDLLHQFGSPATVATMGGRYFGFVTGSVLPASLAAKNLSLFWDQVSAMQVMSPITAKLEAIVEKWLVDLLRLPPNTVAGFVSGSSMANFCGLVAARYRILKNKGWDITEKGLFDAPRIRVLAGRHAHSTILKAVSLSGIGKSNMEWVDVDDQGRIIPELIPLLSDNTILILQAGNVNSGSFDNFKSICQKAQTQGAWVHIDGAFGLWAQASQKLKHLTDGIEFANSWTVDAHKTLNTPYDSGVILCADKEALVSSLHMTGGYIITGNERDGMLYTPEMSRRARIIEFWAALKYLGKDGLGEMIQGFHERAIQFSKGLNEIKGFHILNEVVFNQVLVGCETEEITTQTISKIQELKVCWVGGSTWLGKKVIRISVCSWATTETDVDLSVKSFEKALKMVLQSSNE